jgi:hypothetical protein
VNSTQLRPLVLLVFVATIQPERSHIRNKQKFANYAENLRCNRKSTGLRLELESSGSSGYCHPDIEFARWQSSMATTLKKCLKLHKLFVAEVSHWQTDNHPLAKSRLCTDLFSLASLLVKPRMASSV